MSLAQLKDEAAHLDGQEQRSLIAFLVSLQEDDELSGEKLARQIDDRNPAHWVDLETLEKRFS